MHSNKSSNDFSNDFSNESSNESTNESSNESTNEFSKESTINIQSYSRTNFSTCRPFYFLSEFEFL